MQSNPLDIQELIESCLDFLDDSKPDFNACTLVCRAWVYAAQSRLFRNMTFWNSTTDQHLRISRLWEMSNSPHLLALVLRLEIHLHYLASDSFLGAINQFTRLKEILISGSTPHTTTIAIRALLGLPTVQSVELYCTFPSMDAFVQIWDGCSESIQHLTLGIVHVNGPEYDWASSSASHGRPKLKLKSFRVLLADFILPWVTIDACPFALSQLTTLCVGQTQIALQIAPWSTFLSPPPTIRHLELRGNAIHDPVDLARFPHPRHLTLEAYGIRNMRTALSSTLVTIPPTSHIARLTFKCNWFWPDVFERLDDLLFGMPMPELTEVEVFAEARLAAIIKQGLPELEARGLLSVVSY
ncbi:hypothetical protein B0H19DRAFT_1190464 [Mycena capillaripes]|nr:hypothetical protein B0H19DRAFT_1190464 [Mycena capillaripes]